MKRVFIYVRVSTQEQAKDGYSIGEQIERLQKYCEAMGWIVVKIYTDAGHSGAKIDRPALQEMIEDVKNGKADKVVVYKLDRLSRSQKDTLLLIEDVLLANNTDFVSMTENFDTSTPFGRAMVGILAVFAQLEREQIKERMSMGKDARAKEGKWSGGNTPTGYDYINGELKVNDFEAMQIKELFERFVSGETLYQIESSFFEKGYKMKTKQWCSKSMRYALANKTYIGFIRHRDTWEKGIHDPIIDDKTFATANKILDDRRQRYHATNFKTGNKVHTSYLGGLIYCKKCGARYSKQQSGTKKYGILLNYTCYSRSKRIPKMIKDPNCKNKIHRMHELDEHIFNEIKKLALDPDYFNEVREEKEDESENAKKVALIEKELKSLAEQKSRFLDLYGIGKYSVAELDEKTSPLEEQIRKLQNELRTLKNTAGKLTKDETIEIVKTFADALERGNMSDIRGIIEALIDRIVIDDENITIHWNIA